MRKCYIVLSCFLLMVLFSACVSTSSKPSGFLDNYSKLIPDPEEEGLFFYENPKKKIYQYDAFMLAPILVYFDPAAATHGVDPEKLLEVTEYFRGQVLKSFQGSYRIVPTSGPDVCAIRIAITGVVPEKPRMTADTYTEAFGLSEAALEVIFQDSKTGVTVLAIWDTREHDEYVKKNEKVVTRHAKKTIQNWMKTVMNYLDQAYTEKPKKKTSKRTRTIQK